MSKDLFLNPYEARQMNDIPFNYWGDQENGTYNNPILPADYSDPDIVRVNSDYFAVTSTFQLSPGLTVLHSTDLVNWTIIGGAVNNLTQISKRFNWDRMDGYGRGIWAPCITYNQHNKNYYIHFGTPDEGFFMVKTQHPFGEWSNVYELKRNDGSGFGPGWDDCGVLWDSNGQGYFICTNFSNNYQSWLFKISDDGYTLQDYGVSIHCSFDEYNREECMPEANKVFKANGFYYFLHNGCNIVDNRYVRKAWMLRSKNIYGTHLDGSAGSYEKTGRYEHIPYPIVEGFREPCQGNIIDAATSDGIKWYFFTHFGLCDADGRPCNLLPIVWKDGWPIISDGIKQGEMLWNNLQKPFPTSKKIIPQTSDDFNECKLSPQWMWNFQPRNSKWSLTERPGYLRLYAFKPLKSTQINTAGNTLLQRSYRNGSNDVTIKMDISKMEDGQYAGLLHCAGSLYSAIGVSMKGKKRFIVFLSKDSSITGNEISTEIEYIWFRAKWDFNCTNRFYFSTDGVNNIQFGQEYTLKAMDYRGDFIGIYNFNDLSDSGYVDVDYFKIM
jgi:beta-xylosidase